MRKIKEYEQVVGVMRRMRILGVKEPGSRETVGVITIVSINLSTPPFPHLG